MEYFVSHAISLIQMSKFSGLTCKKLTTRYRNWLQKGEICVQCLHGDDDDFLSHGEFNNKYGLQSNLSDVLQLRHSLPYEWRHTINQIRRDKA